jgi:hypothetical protein
MQPRLEGQTKQPADLVAQHWRKRPKPASLLHLRLLQCRPSDRTFAACVQLAMAELTVRGLGTFHLKLFYPPDESFKEGEVFVYFLPTTNSEPSSSGAIFEVVNIIWCSLGVDFDNPTNSRWKFQDRS